MTGSHTDVSHRTPVEQAQDVRSALDGLLAMLELLSFSQLDSEQRQILGAAREVGRGLARILEGGLGHAGRSSRTTTLPAPNAITSEGGLVLVVDDHPTNRGLLARQLAMLGLRVQAAADGAEALAVWRTGGCLLVITDCFMPGMDGYSLSRAIRTIEAHEGRPRTPIIAWTGNALPSAAAECRAAGMDDMLSKPARLGALKGVLSKWMAATAPVVASPFCVADLEGVAASASERTEILRDFMGQTRSDLADLEAALQRQDLTASVRLAHRMKGASGMVGARGLTAACENMEHAALQGSPADAYAAKEALDRAVDVLVRHLADANMEAG